MHKVKINRDWYKVIYIKMIEKTKVSVRTDETLIKIKIS